MHGSDVPALPGGVDAPETHFGASLLVGTLIASPVLLAALSGRRDVPVALALYLAAIVGSWLVVGIVGGALQLAGRRATAPGAPPEREADRDAEESEDPAEGAQPDRLGASR